MSDSTDRYSLEPSHLLSLAWIGLGTGHVGATIDAVVNGNPLRSLERWSTFLLPYWASAALIVAAYGVLLGPALLLSRRSKKLERSGLLVGAFLILLLSISFLWSAGASLRQTLGRGSLFVCLLVFAWLGFRALLVGIEGADGSTSWAVRLAPLAPLSLTTAVGGVSLWFVAKRGGYPVSLALWVTLTAFGLLGILLSHRLRRRGQWLLLVVLIGLSVASIGSTLVDERVRPPSVGAESDSLAVGTVVLVTIDTLRADHLSSYGADPEATPTLSALARDGIQFDRALAPSPWTLPSMASIMSGVSPLVHGTGEENESLPVGLPTLAEQLSAAGYSTAAIGRNIHLLPRSRLNQGFDSYEFFPRTTIGRTVGGQFLSRFFPSRFKPEAKTHDLTELAKARIRGHEGGGLFLWLHYFDPHIPYIPPEKFLPQGTKPEASRFGDVVSIRAGHFTPNDEQRHWIRSLYEAEVRYVDEELGRVLVALKEKGLYDEALIIVTSDHGEEFWEHGGFEHGHSQHDELLRVPLIVKLPRHEQGPRSVARQIDSPVAITQILSTILDVTAVDYQGEAPIAPSLRPLWEGHAAAPPELVFGMANRYYEDQLSVYFGHFKYITSLLSHHEQLYDLSTDPDEQLTLVVENPDEIEIGRKLTTEYVKEQSKIVRELGLEWGTETEPLPDELSNQLRELGYVQ